MPILKFTFSTCLYSALWILLSLSGTADVLTVGPGGDYQQIADALNVAADGDILLVEPGGYKAITIDHLGVSVVADAGGSVDIVKVTVKNLAAHQTAVLSGITCEISPFAEDVALTLQGNTGSIRCKDCTFRGNGFYHGKNGADLSSCSDVAFVRCSFTGGMGFHDGPGGHGMEAVHSTVMLYDCLLKGGRGGEDFMVEGVDGGDGGDGLHARQTTVFASGNEFIGGDGGDGSNAGVFVDPGDGGDGGDGLELDISPSVAWLLDNTATAGVGGAGGTGSLPPGSPGADGEKVKIIPPSIVHSLAGTANHMETTSPAREGETLQLDFYGENGDDVFILYSPEPGMTFIPGVWGPFLLPLAPFPLFQYMGKISAGSLTVMITVPELGTGIEGVRIHTQSCFRHPLGLVVLGPAETLILLDDSF